MSSSQKKKPTHYKTIFISDIHLGTRGCQAEKLLDFLTHNTCDRLYLVGDIIDGWRLQKRIYWPQSHNDVGKTGYMSDSLEDAVYKCLKLDRSLVWEYSKKWTWEESANQFIKSLVKINYHAS
jgi:UDP-2,3-diacylglucosamine pyrophosphatase LpxH